VKEIPIHMRKPNMRMLAAGLGLAALGAALLVLVTPHRSAADRPLDRIVIEKSARALSTFRAGQMIKRYRIALGQDPIGAKTEEGDMKTPEGIYAIDSRNPASDYHLALHLSYPSAADRARATARGVDPGCDIEIHGLPNGHVDSTFHPARDWTAGCIAMTDEEIEELWRTAPIGTVVEILP
jgi:murein L,D-transpeptidase YafK